MNPAPTEIPASPQTQLSPPIPSQSQSSKKIFIIIGTIILFLLTTTGAFFLGKSQNQSNPANNPIPSTYSNPSSIPTPSAFPTQDPTTNWQIYADTKHNFSFKYPPNLSKCCNIAGPASGKAEQIIVLGDQTTTIQGTDAPFDGFAVYVESNTNNIPFANYIETEKQALLNQAKAFADKDNTGKGISQTFTLAGRSGIILTGYSWDNFARYYINFPNSNKILEISFLQKANSNFANTFPQILSTFQFIDNTQTKTYSHPSYPQLSISYDATWTINVIDNPQTSLPDIKNTIITLSKKSAKLTFDLKPANAFGWGNGCFKNNEINFKTLTNKWTRIKIPSGYIYTTSLFPKGTKEFTSMFDAIVGSTGQNINDYSVCGAGTNESAMALKSNYILPTSLGGDGTKTMSAILDLRLTFTNQEDIKLLDEADSIVTKIAYPSVWN